MYVQPSIEKVYNIYPYNVFREKYIEPFVFAPITVFYGNNGSGKSTLLNIIANSLERKGKEYTTSNSYGIVDYCGVFSAECSYSLGEDDYVQKGMPLCEAKQFLASKEGRKQEGYMRMRLIK